MSKLTKKVLVILLSMFISVQSIGLESFVRYVVADDTATQQQEQETTVEQETTEGQEKEDSTGTQEENIDPTDVSSEETSEANPTQQETSETDNSQAVADEPKESTTESGDSSQGVEQETVVDNATKEFNQSVTVNGVVVSVYAEEGVFPSDASLSVTAVSKKEEAKVEKAIEEVRSSEVNVVSSYVFDIKVLDKDGNEIQPEDSLVKVTFALAEVKNQNLDTNVYHIKEENNELKAESLDVTTEADEAYVVKSDGFSYYSIEFSYNSVTYILMGSNQVMLQSILYYVGLTSYTNIDDATVSNPSAISVVKEGDTWFVSGIDTFNTETLTVVLDGTSYTINISYTGSVNNEGVVSINNIVQGGSPITNSNNSFVKDLPLQAISISDLSKINPTIGVGPSGVDMDGKLNQGFRRSTNDAGTTWTNHAVWSTRGANPSGTLSGLGFGENIVGVSSGGSPKLRRFSNQYYFYRYSNAATLPDGSKADVIVRFENIYNYSTGNLGWLTWTNAANGSFPALWPYSVNGQPVGVQIDVTVKIVEPGTQNEINSSAYENGGYFYTVRGIDVMRYNGLTYDNITQSGSYSNPVDRSSAVAPYRFSESVQVDGSTIDGSIYIPQAADSSLFIDDNGRFVATGTQSDSMYNPGPTSYGTGFVTIGKTDGTKATAWSSARNTSNGDPNTYRGIFFMTPISHMTTAGSGVNGKVELWDDGVAYANNATPASNVKKLMSLTTGSDGNAYTTMVPTKDNAGLYHGYDINDPDNLNNVKKYSQKYKLTDGTYTTVDPTDGTASSYVGYDGVSLSSITKQYVEDTNGNLYKLDLNNTNNAISYSVPNGKVVTYKLIPDAGYSIKTLRVNGFPVNATPRDEYGNIVSNSGNIAYYTYTFDSTVDKDQELYVEWKNTISNCVDCKNLDACENCYLALGGDKLHNYTNVFDKSLVNGAYRGGNALSGVANGNDKIVFDGESLSSNTFAEPLPYGNVYIDTTKLKWDNDTLNNGTVIIEKADPRFKLVGTGKTGIAGSPSENGTMYSIGTLSQFKDITFDADLVGQSDGASSYLVTRVVPTIAYYGPVHSYLMYGDEAALTTTDPSDIYIHDDNRILTSLDSNGDIIPRDNTVADDDHIAHGTYTVTENGQTYSVKVVNGTNVIEPDPSATKPYLYKVTYKDAAILQDGSRGDLVLTVTKVEIESSISSYGNAYIGLQRENEMQIDSSYVKEGYPVGSGSANNVNANKYFPGRNNIDGVGETRNALGAKTTYNVEVLRSDGTPVDGIISYAVNDLDILSWQSIWGRKPSDTYTSNGGSDSSITGTIQDNWTGTYKFYEFAEGLSINSGAVSYALLPNYSHVSANSYDNGQLPINELLKYYWNSGPYSDLGLTDSQIPSFEAPIQVEGTSLDSIANGLRFVTTASGKSRLNDGTLHRTAESGTTGVDLSTNGYRISGNRQAWRTSRNDLTTYDSGFAVLLDAKGAEFTWSGSNHSNGGINTTLFDTKFLQYLSLSHGTGGGIYVEDYELDKQCQVTYRENLVTMPSGASIQTTIVPEDGYRVNKITIDDIKITINYDANDKPISATFEYQDASQSTSGNATTETINFVAGPDNTHMLIRSATTNGKMSTQNENGTNNSNFDMQITANPDGIFDVDIFNRVYPDNKTARHNLHADFDSFYYFTKVWVDAKSLDASELPTSLTFTASPYVMAFDRVTVNGVEYVIEEERHIHLDLLDNNGEKVKDTNGQNIKYDINADGLLLNITGHNRQKYPIVTIEFDLDNDDTRETSKTYTMIDDHLYLVNAAGTDVDSYHLDSNNNLINPIPIIRNEDGYEARLGGVELGRSSNDAELFLVHHIKRTKFVDGSNEIITTNNPDYGDVIFVTITREVGQKPYSKVVLGGDTYIIAGDRVRKVIKDANGFWVVDTSVAPIEIIHEFERYNDGVYINKKTFTVDINDSTQSGYVDTSEWINNGQDWVWKIKYPAKGLKNGNTEVWPALAIETEHIYDDMHEIAVDHVDRLYWFVNERLGTLPGKWALDGYDNSTSEVPGYASYRDSLGNIKYDDTYWYLLSTEEREEVANEMAVMADLRMAFMSPISSQTVKNSSYGTTYNNTKYSGWGGVVSNSVRQTKLFIEKEWIGAGTRTPFKLTITREYNYKQISHSDAVAQNKKVVTLPDGQTFRAALIKLAGGDGTGGTTDFDAQQKIHRFRNGTEPLNINKVNAKDLANIDNTRLWVISNGEFSSEAEPAEAHVYIWFDNDVDGTIYYWTDADEVYLNADSSKMFYDLPNLEQFSGVHTLNASSVTDMSYMFAVEDSTIGIKPSDGSTFTGEGNITNLYNLRDWDTSNVTTLEGFLMNQKNISHGHGLIDWNVVNCDNFEKMFKGSAYAAGKHPFIWYPNVYVDDSAALTGNVLTPEGNKLTKAHSQTTDGTARDLVWESSTSFINNTAHRWWNNGSTTPTNFNSTADNVTWTWFVDDPDLEYSDANKWTYKLYEDEVDGYINAEKATSASSAVDFVYNPLTGRWDAKLTNYKVTDVIVKKTTVDDKDGEFKFRIKFNSLYEPESNLIGATSDTIVVTKRFVDSQGNYLNLSSNAADYVYESGKEYKLTLHNTGSGTNPAGYTGTSVTSTVFPTGWTKNPNGSWSYTFTGIDDENVDGYLVTEPAEASFKYQGSIEYFKFASSETAVEISQDSNNDKYHLASFTNVSTAGDKTLMQRTTDNSLQNKINVTYLKGDGYLREKYVSFDGEQYDTYDVLIAVDKNGNPLTEIDENGRTHLKEVNVYYLGIENGTLIAQSYPAERYTTADAGATSPAVTYYYPEYNSSTHEVIYSDGNGVHVLSKTRHHYYVNETVDASTTPVTEKSTDVWNRPVTTYEFDPDYITQGIYTVTHPATGIKEEYYIVEQAGGVISASRTVVDTNNNPTNVVADVVSSIVFDANSGTADFVTTDGTEYKFTNNSITMIPNVWEFTLKNGEEFTIPNIPLGTTYEVWEYGNGEDWTLVSRNSEKVINSSSTTSVDPASGAITNTATGDGGLTRTVGNSDVIRHIFENKKEEFELKVEKTVTGNFGSKDKYFQFEIELTNAKPNSILTLDTSHITTSFLLGSKIKAPNRATEYTRRVILDANTRDDLQQLTYQEVMDAISSIPKYEIIYEESENGTYYLKTDGTYTTTAPTDSTKDQYVGGNDLATIKKYEQKYSEIELDIYYYLPGSDLYTTTMPTENEAVNYGGYTDNDHLETINKYIMLYVEDSSGHYYKLVDGDYTDLLDMTQPEKYEGYDGSDINSITKYGITYSPYSGPHYKLNNGEYTTTAPTVLTATNYADYTGMDVTNGAFEFVDASNKSIIYKYVNGSWEKYNKGIRDNTFTGRVPGDAQFTGVTGQQVVVDENGNALITVYLQHGQYLTIKGLGKGTKYRIVETSNSDYSTTITNGDGSDLVEDVEVNGEIGKAAVENSNGKYYRVRNITRDMTYQQAKEDENIDETYFTFYDPTNKNIKYVHENDKWAKYDNGVLKESNTGYVPSNAVYTGETVELKGERLYEQPHQYYADYMVDEDINNLPKYKQVYTLNNYGSYYRLKDGAYTTQEPTSKTIENYVGYDGKDSNSPTKYRLYYVYDQFGTYYKLTDGTYTTVAPTNENTANYAEYDGTNLSSIKPYSLVYAKDSSSTYYKLNDGTYVTTAPANVADSESYEGGDDLSSINHYKPIYTINPTATTPYYKLVSDGSYTTTLDTSDYSRYEGYDGSDPTTITKYERSFVADGSGNWYKLGDGTYTQTEPTKATASNYVGYKYTINKYVIDYVEDSDGTYYKVYADDNYTIAYKEESPSLRYGDLTKKYTMDVEKDYYNESRGVVPTRAYVGMASLIALVPIGLLGLYLLHKKKSEEEEAYDEG